MSRRSWIRLSALMGLLIVVAFLEQALPAWSNALARSAVLVQRAAEARDEKEQPDLGKVATALVDRLGAELIKHGPKDRTRKFRVGVFPFGDAEGRYPLELGDNGPTLRGSLVDALRSYLDRRAPGKFTVLYPEQLDEDIRRSSADPKGISGTNLVLARRLLRSFDLDVGVVGRFEVRSLARVVNAERWAGSIVGEIKGEKLTRDDAVRVEARVILPTQTIEGASAISPFRLHDLGYLPQPIAAVRRHSVRFFVQVNDAGAWKEIPLKASGKKGAGGDREGHYYLVVPRAYEGKRYKIVLSNNGKPPLFKNRRKQDPERLFGAAVLIDGVSCFMRHDGKQYRHVSDVPDKLGQWILAPVGKRIVPDAAGTRGRIDRGKLVEAHGKGGSEVHVLGFQKGSEVAGSFVFATAAQSVAAPELLALRKIGTISVYFFGEKLPDDYAEVLETVGPGSLGDPPLPGTAMGKEVRSATFGVKVLHWYAGPVDSWKILYRYEGDASLPADLSGVGGG
jgi:hypothetical protein